MGKLKEKWNNWSDKAEEKLVEMKNDYHDWIERHSTLDRLISGTIIFGGLGGLITWGLIASSNDMKEHPEKYMKENKKTDFDILADTAEKLGLQEGESCQIFVDKNGNTTFKRKFFI